LRAKSRSCVAADVSVLCVQAGSFKFVLEENYMSLQQLNESIQNGRARDAKEYIEKLLAEKVTPKQILDEGLLSAMSVVGTKFKNSEFFVREVLVAARALNVAMTALKPALIEAGVKPVGKVILGTVKGDLHDIGKNLVRTMLESVGFEVVDLGVDVDPVKVVEAIKDTGAPIVALSALLTTTMTALKDTIDIIESAGLRKKVKIMIGGAPVTQEYADIIGADGYAPDAASAAEKALILLNSID